MLNLYKTNLGFLLFLRALFMSFGCLCLSILSCHFSDSSYPHPLYVTVGVITLQTSRSEDCVLIFCNVAPYILIYVQSTHQQMHLY
jgi:hypothetical protein